MTLAAVLVVVVVVLGLDVVLVLGVPTDPDVLLLLDVLLDPDVVLPAVPGDPDVGADDDVVTVLGAVEIARSRAGTFTVPVSGSLIVVAVTT